MENSGTSANGGHGGQGEMNFGEEKDGYRGFAAPVDAYSNFSSDWMLRAPDVVKGNVKVSSSEAKPRSIESEAKTSEKKVYKPKSMKIKDIEYTHSNMVLIDGNPHDNALVARTVSATLDKFMDLRVGYKQKGKDCRTMGSYVWLHEHCAFEAQLWHLPAVDHSKRECLGFELKKKSGSIVAFTDLVNKLAWHLRKEGLASKTADMEDICQPLSSLTSDDEMWSEHSDSDLDYLSDDDDSCPELDDIEIPGPLSMMGSNNTGIRLTEEDNDLIHHWLQTFKTGDCRLVMGSLMTMSKAAKHKVNAAIMAKNRELVRVVTTELNRSVELQAVHSSLAILVELLSSGNDSLRPFLITKCGIFETVCNALKTCTGSTGAKFKNQSNPVMAEACLNILNMLVTDADVKARTLPGIVMRTCLAVANQNKVRDTLVRDALDDFNKKLEGRGY